MNNLPLMLYVVGSLILATVIYNRTPASMLQSVAAGLLSPLLFVVSLVNIPYYFLNIKVKLFVSINSDDEEIGPTQNRRGDE